jgi:dTDP-4-dehydrorhamnose 3,5-epimerase-like enzyme
MKSGLALQQGLSEKLKTINTWEENMNIENCKIISLPKIGDPRGNLTFVEGLNHIPFEIKRVYYLYDVPSGESRGGHAHKELQQLIVAVSGSFDVCMDDGFTKKKITLNRPFEGLYICPGIWRELENFSSGSVCLVFASHEYNEADYIRDYENFNDHVRLNMPTE